MAGRPPDDAELIARAKRGDAAAYEELVRMHQALAFRTAYLLVGSAEEAEDAAQAAFIKAFHALGRFHTGKPFRPWLLRIVANEALNRRRFAARHAALAVRAAGEIRPGDAAPSPEAVVLWAERRTRLAEAVERLSDEHRHVIVCRYFLGLSETETATVLDLRAGTVKSRISRALDRLRRDLETHV